MNQIKNLMIQEKNMYKITYGSFYEERNEKREAIRLTSLMQAKNIIESMILDGVCDVDAEFKQLLDYECVSSLTQFLVQDANQIRQTSRRRYRQNVL